MKLNFSNLLRKVESSTGLNLDSVKQNIGTEQQKPLSAAIFGQTGCGKSSLTNVIFGTNFDVDDVKPCTKEPQSHHGVDGDGNTITFWDLPGIGESNEADARYLDMYAQYASECDVVLWAFQADTRSVALDQNALDSIVSRLDVEQRQKFLSRISIVITKADAITTGPWIFAKLGNEAIVAASKNTEETLEKKALYFFSELLGKHKDLITHRTFITSDLRGHNSLPDSFWVDERKTFLYHQGIIGNELYKQLLSAHPNLSDEFDRLQQQSKAVYCSSRVKFNISAVKAQIAQKGSGGSMLRLHQSVQREGGSLDWESLKNLGLPVFWDGEREAPIFNIQDH
jgi:GTPase Era involved in 16S rRNA processing